MIMNQGNDIKIHKKMLSFLLFFASSKNIFVSVETEKNSLCTEESPCSFDDAFSQLNDTDFLVLTDKTFTSNQTNVFLSKLIECKCSVTILGNGIDIFSENNKIFSFVQHEIDIKFSGITFRSVAINFNSLKSTITLSNVRFINCNFVDSFSYLVESAISMDNVSFVECSGCISESNESTITIINSLITKQKSEKKPMFSLNSTTMQVRKTNITKTIALSFASTYLTILETHKLRLSNIQTKDPFIKATSSSLKIRHTNVTKFSSLSSIMFVDARESAFILEKSIVTTIVTPENQSFLISCSDSAFSSKIVAFLNMKKVMFGIFNSTNVTLEKTVIDNNTLVPFVEPKRFSSSIQFYDATVKMQSTKIINSTAPNSVLYSYNSSLEIDKSSFIGSHGTIGAALFIKESSAVIKESTFERNEADDMGGAICSSNATLKVYNSVFEYNKATRGADFAFKLATEAVLSNVSAQGNGEATFIDANGKGTIAMINVNYKNYAINAIYTKGIEIVDKEKEDVKKAEENTKKQQQATKRATPTKDSNVKYIGDVVYEEPTKKYSPTLVLGLISVFIIASSFVGILTSKRVRPQLVRMLRKAGRRQNGKDV